MSLFTATLITGLFLILVGGLLIWYGVPFGPVAKKSLRSFPVTLVTMGLAAGWFLYHVAHLGEADFGKYKEFLFIFFLAIAVFAFSHAKDFLAVRGGAVLVMLAAKVLLDAAYMQEPRSRLFMVSFVYLCIIAALYLGTVPYRLRDLFDWLFAHHKRAKLLGYFFGLYGVLLCGVAFAY